MIFVIYYLIGFILLNLICWFTDNVISLGNLMNSLMLSFIWPIAVPIICSVEFKDVILIRRRRK